MVMRRLVGRLALAFLFADAAALLSAGPALAAPADLVGTWECRQPGVQYRNKPPILYFADAPGGSPSEVTVEVDGFAREVYGRADLAQDPNGWWKIKPAKGQEFSVRPEAAAKQRTAAMVLRWPDSKSDYRCLRLPPSAAANRPLTQPSPGAENPQGTLSVPPSGATSQEPEKTEPENKQ
jgi:hypothetical protein